MRFRKEKIVLFILCVFLLFFMVYIFFREQEDSILDNFSHDFIENNDFVAGISIGDDYAAYDKGTFTYYFPKNLYTGQKLHIESPYKTRYDIEKIDDSEYSVTIYSDMYYQKRTLKLVNGSIISINQLPDLDNLSNVVMFNELSIYNKKDVPVSFRILDNNSRDKSIYSKSFSVGANARVRGSSSSVFDKKAFRIEFNDNKNVLNMGFDDDWILDALYTDKSKIRNKLSYDIWNLVNDNQRINNDLYGSFVEVFIDNEYDGLFVIKDRVDKSKLNVSSNGLIAKSYTHINDDLIDEFETKYPVLSENNCKFNFVNLEFSYCDADSLNTFVSRMREYYDSSNYWVISEYFDMDSYINYYTFISFIQGSDNVSKNLYFSLSDPSSKILLTPWDLDLSWGLGWDPVDELHSSFVMGSSTDGDWLRNYITNGMDDKTYSLLKDRYWELRKDVFTMDTINEYLDSYKEQLISSGAARRDSDRWYEYDIEFEIEQIREWSEARIDFLDQYFK